MKGAGEQGGRGAGEAGEENASRFLVSRLQSGKTFL